jgi:hypothetical protein
MGRLPLLGALLLAAAVALYGLGRVVGVIGGGRRMGVPFLVVGLVMAGGAMVILFAGLKGDPLVDAPGHDVRDVGGGRLVFTEEVRGVGGAPTYRLDLRRTDQTGEQVADALTQRLTPLGYRPQAPPPGPVLADGPEVGRVVGQVGLDRFRWRVVELPLPTRFAGVVYQADGSHLVAIVLSDDGR